MGCPGQEEHSRVKSGGSSRRINVLSFVLIPSPNSSIVRLLIRTTCTTQTRAVKTDSTEGFVIGKEAAVLQEVSMGIFFFSFFSHSPLPRCRKHLAAPHCFTASLSVVCFITSIRALPMTHPPHPRPRRACGPTGCRPALANHHRS